MFYNCDLCFAECVYERTYKLDLPVTGSEGVRVCFACKKVLTDVAYRIRQAGITAIASTQRRIKQ
jgi:hypothetical protein